MVAPYQQLAAKCLTKQDAVHGALTEIRLPTRGPSITLDEMEKPEPRKVDGQTCFVIMPFGPPFDRYYANIFVPAIESAGLQPLRADSIFSPSTIMADIWRWTRTATVVLADVTGKNANVFYELGLAHASGKPVVLVTNYLADVPFDLQGLRIIEYDKEDEAWGATLQAHIVAALRATLEAPELSVPAVFLDRSPSASAPMNKDPLFLQMRQIMDELRAWRIHRRTAPAQPEARRLMQLLDRHSSILQGVLQETPEPARLQIFEDLLRGDFSAATVQVEKILNVSHARALEITTNIAEWMELFAGSSL